MQKKVAYDYVISLGERCATTQCLKRHNLRPRGFKLPFDWMIVPFETSVAALLNNFDDFIAPYRWHKIQYPLIPKLHFCNRFYDGKNKASFIHEFPSGASFARGASAALDVFIPKINRMRTVMKSGKRILFVYMIAKRVPKRVICESVQKLREHFNNQNIDLLVIESGVNMFLPCCWARIMHGVTKCRTKLDVINPKWDNTTPQQFKYIDKIFSKICVSHKVITGQFADEHNAIS